jgi:hypothetical protein
MSLGPDRTMTREELEALSDDLLLDNFHWAQPSDSDNEYDFFRAELVRRLKGQSQQLAASSQQPGASS